MSKRVALVKDGLVFNIVIGDSAENMAQLFACEAIEVTEATKQAHLGYGIVDGVFEQPPLPPEPEPDPNQVLTTPES